MIFTLIPFSGFAAGSGTEQVSYTVLYNQSAARRMLKLINNYRTSEDDAWVYSKPSKANKKESKIPLELSKLTYDYTLEKIAMQRAAEIAIYLDHTRPNGASFDTLMDSNYSAWAENCAGGYSDYESAFKGWLETDKSYSGQGHRRNILSEDYNAIGISCVVYNDNYYWVQIFGKTENPNRETVDSNNSDKDVSVEVNPDLINSIKITSDADTPYIVGMDKPAELPELTTKMVMDESWPGSDCVVTPEYKWASSDRSVVKVSGGKLVGVKEGTATVTATALGVSCSIQVQVSKDVSPFKDVKNGSYCYDAVMWAVENEITNGIDKTHFAPDQTCTRAQIVTFLWREADSPEPKTKKCPFKDVSKDAYYYKAVLWAYENDITTGVDAKHFAPDDDCTRGQVATFLWKANEQPKASVTKNPFKDVAKSDYYYKAVLWAYGEKITTGVDKKHFAPDEPCTRGQIVTFLYRV